MNSRSVYQSIGYLYNETLPKIDVMFRDVNKKLNDAVISQNSSDRRLSKQVSELNYRMHNVNQQLAKITTDVEELIKNPPVTPPTTPPVTPPTELPDGKYVLDENGVLMNINKENVEFFIEKEWYQFLPGYMLVLDDDSICCDYETLSYEDMDRVVKIIYNNIGMFNNEDYDAGCPYTFNNCREVMGIGYHTKTISSKYVYYNEWAWEYGESTFQLQELECTFADPFPNINRIIPNVEIVDLTRRLSYVGSLTIIPPTKVGEDAGRFKNNYYMPESYYQDGYDCSNSALYDNIGSTVLTQDKNNYVGPTCSKLHTVRFDPRRVVTIPWLCKDKNITSCPLCCDIWQNSVYISADASDYHATHNTEDDYGYDMNLYYEGFKGDTLKFEIGGDYGYYDRFAFGGANRWNFTKIENLNQSTMFIVGDYFTERENGELIYIKEWDLYDSDVTNLCQLLWCGDKLIFPKKYNPNDPYNYSGYNQIQYIDIPENASQQVIDLIKHVNIKEVDLSYCDDYLVLSTDNQLFIDVFRYADDIYMPFAMRYIQGSVLKCSSETPESVPKRIHFFDEVQYYDYDQPLCMYSYWDSSSWNNVQKPTTLQSTIVIHYRKGYDHTTHPIYLKYIEFGLEDKIEFVEHPDITDWYEYRSPKRD